MTLKVGVVGIGGMGGNHARVYHQMPNVELVGICDLNQNRCKELASLYKTKSFADYNELFKEGLDAVNIVVPTVNHKEVALAAFKAKINVLLEKPISDTVENGLQITKAAEKAGVKLQIGHIERFNPAVKALKQRVKDGLLGDIVSMSSTRVGPHNPRIRDVGVTIDLAVHDIDIMCDLIGQRVKQVFASSGKVIHERSDWAMIHMTFEDGAAGVIDTNWLTPFKVRELKVVGTKGFAVVKYMESTLIYHDGRAKITYQEVEQEPLRNELEYFIDCVSNNKEPEITGYVGCRALKLALAAVESARTKKPILID
ncbi:MAG: Gfo/Idh/MocA family oxidoreductase [Candidatus Altiarchaeota archaeon]